MSYLLLALFSCYMQVCKMFVVFSVVEVANTPEVVYRALAAAHHNEEAHQHSDWPVFAANYWRRNPLWEVFFDKLMILHSYSEAEACKKRLVHSFVAHLRAVS